MTWFAAPATGAWGFGGLGSSDSGWRPFAEAGDEKKERAEVTAGMGRRTADWLVAGVRREGRAYRRNLGAERENMVNCGCCWSMQIEEELGAAAAEWRKHTSYVSPPSCLGGYGQLPRFSSGKAMQWRNYPVIGEDITVLSFLYPLEYLLGL